ncbi:hypothetical protein BZG36_02167 [Bifiguratus adelaidae]|uniref:Uncharacterized protein n=1 Tax=Bifiguratus adelaidae TaxID=1938954 RepID=A0A261Y0M6_9FUNG|nr:hypothetical protein BZG36_02167 [Bifiguratus adelaidae]
MPVILPVTAAYSCLFAGYSAFLSLRVSKYRGDTGIMIGDGQAAFDTPAKPGKTITPKDLYAAIRAHANFAENVPFALTLIALLELNGGSRRSVHALLATLLTARILHSEAGIRAENNLAFGRPVGTLASTAVIVVAGYLNAALAWPVVRRQLQ